VFCVPISHKHKTKREKKEALLTQA